MRISFTKTVGGGLSWAAVRSDHTKVSLAPGGPQRGLPHDLVHYVVEGSLGIERGFWGSIAAGGSLRTTTASHRKGKRAGGRGLLRRNARDLIDAEAAITNALQAWKRGDKDAVTEALSDMQQRWDAIQPGGTMQLRWPPSRAPKR